MFQPLPKGSHFCESIKNKLKVTKRKCCAQYVYYLQLSDLLHKCADTL